MSRRLEDRLLGTRVPGEEQAEERAWRVVHAAYAQRLPVASAKRVGRLALALAACLALLAIALSPAGAAVVDVVRDAIGFGEEDTKPVLRSLPAPGELLVDSEAGPWIVRQDGSKRLLGDYGDAAWSPRGLFVAAAAGRQLVAVDPLGEVRWTVSVPAAVRDPRWSPGGLRIAYRSGDQLRVVGADGGGDRMIAAGLAPRPPAWRPVPEAKLDPTGSAPGAHQLAYADAGGGAVVVDAESGAEIQAAPTREARGGRRIGPIRALAWSPDGTRLLALTSRSLHVDPLSSSLKTVEYTPPGAGRLEAAAFAPFGDRLALLRQGPGGSEILVVRTAPGESEPHPRTVFAGPGRIEGVTWSPDGRWLLAEWRDADQWLFIRSDRPQRLVAVGDISRQFDPGGSDETTFPRVGGWVLPRR